MTDDELRAIEARLGAAMPGPWYVDAHSRVRQAETKTYIAHSGRNPRQFDTINFIAHAPGDIAALLAEVRRLRAALEEIDRTTVGAYESGFGDLEVCDSCSEMRTIAENALRP